MDKLLPGPVAQGLAAVGLIFVTAKLFGFVRLLLDLFVLPGTSVYIAFESKIQANR